MEQQKIIIRTALAPNEVVDKLRSITITDLSQLHGPAPVSYYGEIARDRFSIRNVRFGPHSAAPSINGQIQQGLEGTVVTVEMNIREYHELTRRMYYSTLLPLGALVLLLSIAVLGGTAYQVHGYIFSFAFVLCAVAAVALSKASLLGMRKREIKRLALTVNGRVEPGTAVVHDHGHSWKHGHTPPLGADRVS